MFHYYTNYDFTNIKQDVKIFWKELIVIVITMKNQIFVTQRDLQDITTIYYMMPESIRKILVELRKDCVIMKEEDITEDKKILNEEKPWYNKIMPFTWVQTS